MDFISAYLNHSKDYESPTSFWKWSAYAAIAAVLRDNCYRRQGDSFLFPSVYILLLAKSSVHRKGRPVELCEQLVSKVGNTKIISGRTSIQAILDELAHVETNKDTGKITKGGSAIFYAPELSAGIVDDPNAIKILTDIYDFKPNPYVSRLRTQGKFKIEKLVFSIMAASNEDMIKELYNTQAIQGGMLARTLLIVPDEFRPSNSLMRQVDRTASFENLMCLLTQISKLNGEYTITEEAIDEYEGWYKPFREGYKTQTERTGIVGRIHTHVLKLAMILAANDLTLIITQEHIEEAIAECTGLLQNYTIFSMSTGKSTISEAGSIVLVTLLHAPNHRMSQRKLLQNNWSNFELELLEKVIATFQVSGLVISRVEGSEMTYELTAKCLETMKGKGEGI